MKCKNCGKENSENARFCAECGKALNDTPIQLNLDEINIPAAARKAHIIKVNAKKVTTQSEIPDAAPANTDEQNNSTTETQVTAAPAQEEPAASAQTPVTESPLIDLSTGKATIATETPAQATVQPATPPSPASEAAPMRIINWIVVFILTSIPVVNVVMLLIWAISSKTNPSKKSFAQATLIFGAVILVLGVAAYFVLAKFIGTDPVTSWNQFM